MAQLEVLREEREIHAVELKEIETELNKLATLV